MLLGRIYLLLIILIEYAFTANEAAFVEGKVKNLPAAKSGTKEDNGDSNDCLESETDRMNSGNLVEIKPETIKEFKEFLRNSLNSESSKNSNEANNLLLKAEANNNFLTQQDFRSFDFIIKQIKNKVDSIHKETENGLTKVSYHYKLDENTIANVGTVFLFAKAIFDTERSRKQCEIIENILLKYRNKDYLNRKDIKSLQRALAHVREWIEIWITKKKVLAEGYELPFDEDLKFSPLDLNDHSLKDKESKQEIDTILLVSEKIDDKKTKITKRNIFQDLLNVMSKIVSGIAYAHPSNMVTHVTNLIKQFLPQNDNSTSEAVPNSTIYSIPSSAMSSSTQASIIYAQNPAVVGAPPPNVEPTSTPASVIYAPGPVYSSTPSYQSYNNNNNNQSFGGV